MSMSYTFKREMRTECGGSRLSDNDQNEFEAKKFRIKCLNNLSGGQKGLRIIKEHRNNKKLSFFIFKYTNMNR